MAQFLLSEDVLSSENDRFKEEFETAMTSWTSFSGLNGETPAISTPSPSVVGTLFLNQTLVGYMKAMLPRSQKKNAE